MNITGLRTSSKFGADIQGIDELLNEGWNIVQNYTNTLLDLGLTHTSYGVKEKGLLKFQGANIYWYMIQLMINMRQELIDTNKFYVPNNLSYVRDKYNLDCVESNLTCLSKKYSTDYKTVYKALLDNYFTVPTDSYVPVPPTPITPEGWYLPSIDEVKEIYNVLNTFYIIPLNLSIMSSTEVDINNFYYNNFSINFNISGSKSALLTYVVLPVRDYFSVIDVVLGEEGELGYIFAKEAVTGGYKVYEAATAYTNDYYVWCSDDKKTLIGTTSAALGEGKSNTQKILAEFAITGDTNTGAQYCKNFKVNP